MNVDDVVAEKIAAARARAEAAKRRRAALNASRQRGLAARHAQKLRNLATPREGAATVTETVTTVSVNPTETDDSTKEDQ